MRLTEAKNIEYNVQRVQNLIGEKATELSKQSKTLQKTTKNSKTTIRAKDLIEPWCWDLIERLKRFCKQEIVDLHLLSKEPQEELDDFRGKLEAY